MQIRLARLDDIETLFHIRTSVVENHQSREELARLGVTPETIAQMLQTHCRAWIAEIDGQAVGFSFANAAERMVFGLFVLPAFEGRGAGRALMQQAEEWLWSQGTTKIQLYTGNQPSLRAYGFYQHLGWEVGEVQSDRQIKFVKRKPV
ncbi:GNAT family N-acetyltransferase [Leptolyngbya sp. FACHB-711]|uniref:GNAT family N-acetyltransferase n=1 Tax=unclassified Leptolyngbya TaxID=2650499 RepID=UPI001688C3CA|nr:GNAT family N-acetyltransferase [Leptolyngbya sp. FACHB-711]MBD1853734.1 GNAT family N-acetyltransferase [Cyanobacteria bacterium FACHB-502]MBD2026089.1 GNAT family N-acetyltransferase [Leptolyngbya sp. FACHB-711]